MSKHFKFDRVWTFKGYHHDSSSSEFNSRLGYTAEAKITTQCAEGALVPIRCPEGDLSHEKLLDRARDELFSHVHRCGVLQAEIEDQKHWMDETIDYIGERYPDLSDADLKDLHQIGIRFLRPAIAHGSASASKSMEDATVA